MDKKIKRTLLYLSYCMAGVLVGAMGMVNVTKHGKLLEVVLREFMAALLHASLTLKVGL